MSISAGDAIDLEEYDANEPWWLGRCGNRRGLFPASYVQRADIAPVAASSAPAAAAAAVLGIVRIMTGVDEWILAETV